MVPEPTRAGFGRFTHTNVGLVEHQTSAGSVGMKALGSPPAASPTTNLPTALNDADTIGHSGTAWTTGGPMALPAACPQCHRPMVNHCPRGCGWLTCRNVNCPVRYVDQRGHVTRVSDG